MRLWGLLSLFLFAPSAHASVGTLAQQLGDLLADGKHFQTEVKQTTTIDRIQEFMIWHVGGDIESLKDYKFVDDVTEFLTGLEQAGILRRSAVKGAVAKALEGGKWSEEEMARVKKASAKIVTELSKDTSVQFGYDAAQKNGCEEDTPYFIVVDEKENHVYGFDLNPCL